MTKIGHNSGFAADQLLSFVERIESLEEEQYGLAEDKREVYSEAKGVGFDTAVIRKVIAWRKKDPADRKEAEAIFDLYRDALEKASEEQTAKSREDGE